MIQPEDWDPDTEQKRDWKRLGADDHEWDSGQPS